MHSWQHLYYYKQAGTTNQLTWWIHCSLCLFLNPRVLLVHQGIRSRKINKRNDLLMSDIVQDCSHSWLYSYNFLGAIANLNGACDCLLVLPLVSFSSFVASLYYFVLLLRSVALFSCFVLLLRSLASFFRLLLICSFGMLLIDLLRSFIILIHSSVGSLPLKITFLTPATFF